VKAGFGKKKNDFKKTLPQKNFLEGSSNKEILK
jgi:hypothetical protein